jgi:hypothetical protein
MLTARASHSQMGKPLKADMQVPRYARQTYNHKIAWSRSTRLSFEYYNSIVVRYNDPCWRRYCDHRFGPRVGKNYEYLHYIPPPLIPYPERVWTLVIDGVPTSCFTNVVEAWLVMIGLNKFGSVYDTHLIYTERK